MILKGEKIKRARANYTGNISVQTGFPSPATHYHEPAIDLNKELSSCREATFFIRVSGNDWEDFNILNGDVLIVDRSLEPLSHSLNLVVIGDSFDVIRTTCLENSQYTLWGVITYIIHKAV